MSISTNVLGLGLLAVCSGATAQIIYDNGPGDCLNGNEMTAWVQAEDFTLKQDGSADCASFDLLTVGGFGNWDQSTMQYQFYKDNGGAPDYGALVSNGVGTGVAVTFEQTGPFGDCYNVAFDFSSGPVNFAAGTKYWMALHLSNDYQTRQNLYWGTTAFNGTSTGHEDDFGDGNGFFDNGQEHAFQIGCVPTPGTAALLGISALAATRRRR